MQNPLDSSILLGEQYEEYFKLHHKVMGCESALWTDEGIWDHNQ
jgi:hypothetical protein